MGETTPTSWKAGLCLFLFCVAILLLGWKIGGGADQPQRYQLTCVGYSDGTFDCRRRP